MKRQVRYGIMGLVAAIALLAAFPAGALDNPKERIDYWLKTYTELKDDPRVKQANEVFDRVLKAAGSRPGVIPRLLIVDYDKWVACAIRDGGIVISKKVLDICYQNPQRGDDRLAFLLGHEIAHQLKDDFWHLRFFEAIDASQDKSGAGNKVLEEVRNIAGSTDKVLAKELEADEHGIIFASMAGFNINAVITEDDKVNFFEEVLTILDPARIPGVHKDPSHPSPKERAVAVKARLRQVLDNVELFHLGVLFYQAGMYEQAILAFKKFLTFFPSREVYHNIASCYHQLALRYYQTWKGEEKAVPFKLSMAIDPSTRASMITLRGGTGTESADLFKKNIEKAIECYEMAISLDPSYYLAYNNLGCALIVQDRAFKAVSMFQDALEIKPDCAEALNNLGVAFYYTKNSGDAKESLAKARELNPTYSAPLFNLTKIAQEEKNSAEAKKYGEAYLELDSASPWAHMVRETLSLEEGKQMTLATAEKGAEKVLGLETAVYDDDVPQEWGKPDTKEQALEQEPFRINTYANRVMTLSQDDEIKLIVTLDGFKGKTARGIALGSPEKNVIAAYGSPAQVLDMTQGATWVYGEHGIAFQFRNGKVVSWLLF
ncbi:MAG: tetratricopeptide repeat protein [Deltaproteobacteria bacterium]|nr:tetratricopeptide repeat protein [Deltaproteobacteria bacterium]